MKKKRFVTLIQSCKFFFSSLSYWKNKRECCSNDEKIMFLLNCDSRAGLERGTATAEISPLQPAEGGTSAAASRRIEPQRGRKRQLRRARPHPGINFMRRLSLKEDRALFLDWSIFVDKARSHHTSA